MESLCFVLPLSRLRRMILSNEVLNRQISLTTLDSSAEYVYDALGRRVAKVVDGATTYYLYNADSQVIE